MSEDNYNDFEKNDDEINDDEKNDEEKVISELRDLGFSIRISEKASFYCENNLKHCLEWIYYHQDDNDFNDELDTSNPDESKYYKNLNRKPASNNNNNNNIYYNNNNDNNELNNNNNNDNNEINNSYQNDKNNFNHSNLDSNNNFDNSSKINNNDPNSKTHTNGSNEYSIFNNSKKIIEPKDENSIRSSMIEVYSKKLKNQNESPEKNNREEESNKKINESEDEIITEGERENKNENEEEEKSSLKVIYTKDENISFYIKTLKKLYGNKSFYGDTILTCFQTLKKMLENIINEPDNKKYLVINLDNNDFNERVGKYPIAIKLLEEIGFTKIENNKLSLDEIEHDLIQNTIDKLNNEIQIL